MWVAALGFLLLPLSRWLWAREHNIVGVDFLLSGTGFAALLPAAFLLCGSYLVCRSSFGAQMLSRAIAGSNLVVGALIAGTTSGVAAFGGALVACACGIALLRLRDSGLDGSGEGAEHPFQPVAYRGFLVLALVMAFADAQTLLFSSCVQVGNEWSQGIEVIGRGDWQITLLAGGLMAVNVWGLYRLRVWALVLNIVANVAIAHLALVGELGVSIAVAGALATTAAVQLLLPVPVLATVMGDRNAGRWMVGPRLVTGALVLLTLVGAGAGLYGGLVGRDSEGWVTRGTRIRGATSMPRTMIGKPVFDGQYMDVDFSQDELEGASFRDANIMKCKFRGAKLHEADLHRVSAWGVDFTGADLSSASFVGARLAGATLRNADLAGADMSGADLSGADLSGTNLIGVDWAGATCPDRSAAEDHDRGCADAILMLDVERARELAGTYRADRRFLLGMWRTELELGVDERGQLVTETGRFIPRADGTWVREWGTPVVLRVIQGAIVLEYPDGASVNLSPIER
jgi:hypothetical protein